MPLQNFQYDTIMREYSRRQAQYHRILEEHTAEAYGKIPRLKAVAPFIKLFVTVQSQADFQEKVSVLLAETDTFEWKSIWREATTK